MFTFFSDTQIAHLGIFREFINAICFLKSHPCFSSSAHFKGNLPLPISVSLSLARSLCVCVWSTCSFRSHKLNKLTVLSRKRLLVSVWYVLAGRCCACAALCVCVCVWTLCGSQSVGCGLWVSWAPTSLAARCSFSMRSRAATLSFCLAA